MSLKRLICIGAVTLVASAVGASAWAKPRTSVVTNPDWLERPNGDDVSALYPPIALEFNISGRAALVCAVDSYGALEDCTAEEESPKGLGFGAAAVALAPKFRMTPKMVDGRPVVGGSVRIPINFNAPKAEEIPPPPPPLSAAGTDQARALVKLLWQGNPTAFRMWQDQLDVTGIDVDDETQAAAKKALDETAPAYEAHILAHMPAYYAAELQAEEIQAVIRFFQSAAGKKIVALSPLELTENRKGEAQNLRDLLTQQARDEFCLDHPCSTFPDSKTMRQVDETWQPDIVDPDMGEAASAEQIWAAFPLVPKWLRISGWSTLVCKVGALGLLEDCAVAIEQPPGLGFGAAALSLAPRYRLAPAVMAYGAHRSSVAVPILFETPTRVADETLPAPETSAMAVARRLVALDAQTWPSFEADAADLLAVEEGSLGPGVKRDAIVALRRSRETWRRHAIELETAVYTDRYTEAELRQLVAFRESPAGAKWSGSSFYEKLAPVFSGAAVVAQKRARAQFCRSRDCERQPAPGADR
jgi:TonB family protein